jgi:hypothetical protein
MVSERHTRRRPPPPPPSRCPPPPRPTHPSLHGASLPLTRMCTHDSCQTSHCPPCTPTVSQTVFCSCCTWASPWLLGWGWGWDPSPPPRPPWPSPLFDAPLRRFCPGSKACSAPCPTSWSTLRQPSPAPRCPLTCPPCSVSLQTYAKRVGVVCTYVRVECSCLGGEQG